MSVRWEGQPAAQGEAMTKIKVVYTHIVGNKVKFNFRFDSRASVAGEYRYYYYDEAYSWIYFPTPGLGANPSDKWLYNHKPLD